MNMSSRRKNKTVEQVFSKPHASALCSHIRRVIQADVEKMNSNSHISNNFQQAVILHDPKSDLRLKYDEKKSHLSCVVTTGYLFDKWLKMNLDFHMEKVRGEDKHWRQYHNSRTTDDEQYLVLDSLWKMVERGEWGLRYDDEKKNSLFTIKGSSGRENSPLYITSRRYASLGKSKKSIREYKKYFNNRNALVAMRYQDDDEYNQTIESVIKDQKDNHTNYRYDGGFGDVVGGTHEFAHHALICEILHLKNLLSNPSFIKGTHKIGGKNNA
jgi:hypothetical protein